MSDLPALRQFFGDQDRDFRLTPELIAELERLSLQGIGGFTKRFFGGDFKLADLHAVIRLALIGGGTDPKEAAALIAAYVTPRPILESFALAVAILDFAMTGATGEAEIPTVGNLEEPA